MRIAWILIPVMILAASGCGSKSTEPVQLQHSIVDPDGGKNPGDDTGKPKGRILPPPR